MRDERCPQRKKSSLHRTIRGGLLCNDALQRMLIYSKIEPTGTNAPCEFQTTLLVLRGGGQSPTMKLRSSFRNLLRPRNAHSATNSATAATASEPDDEPVPNNIVLSRWLSIALVQI